MRYRPFDEGIAKLFSTSPACAADLLSDLLANGEEGEFITILCQMSLAARSIKDAAGKADLNHMQ